MDPFDSTRLCPVEVFMWFSALHCDFGLGPGSSSPTRENIISINGA